MRKKLHTYTILALVMAILAVGCKSEYEQIRTSGDPQLILSKALEYYEAEEYQRAQSLFELVAAVYRGKKEAEEIAYKNAYTYYHPRNYLLSSYYFKNFAQTYSTSPYRQEADFMSAYSNYNLSPKFRLDQTYTDKAIEELQLFINTYPDSERVTQCNDLIDELRAKLETKAFDEGMLYFNLRSYTASVRVFENLLKDFPETQRTDQIRYMIIRSSYLLAENSILQRQPERYRVVVELGNEFVDRFEESDYAKEVATILANSQKKLNQLKDVGYQNQSAGTGS